MRLIGAAGQLVVVALPRQMIAPTLNVTVVKCESEAVVPVIVTA